MSNQHKRFPEDAWKIIKSYMIIPKPTTCVECSGEKLTINKNLYSFPDTKNCGNIVDKDNKIKKFIDYSTNPRKDRTLDYDSLDWYYKNINGCFVCDIEEQDKIRQSVLTSKLVYNLPIIKWYCVYCFPTRIKYLYAEEYIKTQYPKEYPNEHRDIFYKKVDKEYDLNTQKNYTKLEDPYLFRTHRLKKTQDKIKFYFDLIFKKQKLQILNIKRLIEDAKTNLVTLQQKQIIKNNKKLREIKVKRMNTIMNEIILRKVAILFTAKKISYKTYTHIMNFIFDDSYNNNRERETFIFSWENIIIKFNLEPSTLNDVLPHIVL